MRSCSREAVSGCGISEVLYEARCVFCGSTLARGAGCASTEMYRSTIWTPCEHLGLHFFDATQYASEMRMPSGLRNSTPAAAF